MWTLFPWILATAMIPSLIDPRIREGGEDPDFIVPRWVWGGTIMRKTPIKINNNNSPDFVSICHLSQSYANSWNVFTWNCVHVSLRHGIDIAYIRQTQKGRNFVRGKLSHELNRWENFVSLSRTFPYPSHSTKHIGGVLFTWALASRFHGDRMQ